MANLYKISRLRYLNFSNETITIKMYHLSDIRFVYCCYSDYQQSFILEYGLSREHSTHLLCKGSITVWLSSCLTGLDSTKRVNRYIGNLALAKDLNPNKTNETSRTVILHLQVICSVYKRVNCDSENWFLLWIAWTWWN